MAGGHPGLLMILKALELKDLGVEKTAMFWKILRLALAVKKDSGLVSTGKMFYFSYGIKTFLFL